MIGARRVGRGASSARGSPRPASGRLERPAGTSLLTAIAFITVFPFLWMLLTSLKGPNDPILSVPPQFLPDRPDAANYQKVLETRCRSRASSRTASSCRSRSGCSTCWSPPWRPTRSPRSGSGAARDLLPAARDADRAGPADLHPELRARGQRLPLLRLAAGADLPEPRQRLQHLPAAPGVPRRPQRPPRRGPRRRRRRVADLVVVMLPIIRPSLAAVAIFTFVMSWNDFLWPSLMLHTARA